MRFIYYTNQVNRKEEIEKEMRKSGFLKNEDSIWFAHADYESIQVVQEEISSVLCG